MLLGSSSGSSLFSKVSIYRYLDYKWFKSDGSDIEDAYHFLLFTVLQTFFFVKNGQVSLYLLCKCFCSNF